MEIELRLKKVLVDHGLDDFGVTAKIARQTGLHRHTCRKIYNNKMPNASLYVLGHICAWLVEHGVPADKLPGALLGARPSGLWQAVAAPGTVKIFLGEYRQVLPRSHMSWIAKRDASVVTGIVGKLSTPGVGGNTIPAFRTEYLPFRVDVSAQRISKDELERNQTAAKHMYQRMRADLKGSSAILIGSQRINQLVETLVADMFRCPPFVAQRRDVRVPFYLAYKTHLRPVESCFGGRTPPPGAKGKFVAGTHYLNRDDKWVCLPWIDGKEDSGIVVTLREEERSGILLAVFGLSGRASEALGRFLTRNETPFWPPKVVQGTRGIGVYVCKLTYHPKASGDTDEPAEAKDVEVVPIDPAILTKYLDAKQ